MVALRSRLSVFAVLLAASAVLVAACSSEAANQDVPAPVDAGTSSEDASDGPDAAPDAAPAGPVILSLGTGASFEAESHVVAGPDGTLLAVWSAFPATGGVQNGYAISRDHGATWTKAALAPGSSVGDPVATRGADGSFYFGYLDGTCSGGEEGCVAGHVWVARLSPGSDSFEARVDVSPADPAEFYDKPWLMTASDGTLVAVFNGTVGQYPDNVSSIIVARSAGAGAPWTRTYAVPKRAKGELANIPHACISRSAKRMWVVYVDSTSPTGVTLRWSDDRGVTWPDANASSGFALPEEAAQLQSYDLRCVGEGDDVWVMYGLAGGPASATGIPPLASIHVAHSHDGGKTWDKTTVVSEAGEQFLRPELILEPGGALDLFAFRGTKDGDKSGDVHLYRSVDSGATFTPVGSLLAPMHFTGARSGTEWIGDYSGVALDDGRLVATVVDNSSGVSHIAFVQAPR